MSFLRQTARHFRTGVLLHVALVAVSAGSIGYVVAADLHGIWAVLAGLVLVRSAVTLVRRSERFLRGVRDFLSALQQHDYAIGMVDADLGTTHREMAAAMAQVMRHFRADRAAQEERRIFLESVIEHVGTALVAYTPDGEITLINAAARRLLNLQRIRQMDTLEHAAPELAEVLVRLKPDGQVLLRSVLADGRSRDLLVHGSTMTVGGHLQTLAAIYDIGHELEEREMKAWQQLTRVLTHEIMNSVAPISSLAATAEELLAGDRDGRPEDIADAVRVIRRRSDALAAFIDAYRSFTQIPAPNFRLSPVGDLLARVHRLMRTQAERQSLTFTYEVRPESLQLPADPDLIEQVLINLVLNAFQALGESPGGSVRLSARPDRRGVPAIDVEDNGPGIAPGVRERIFVPFFTTKAEGSGIGLSLSRQIMRLHGGAIEVQSEPGRTVFMLRF